MNIPLIVCTIVMGAIGPESTDMPSSPKGMNGPSESNNSSKEVFKEPKKILDYVWKHRKRGFKIRDDQVYAFLAAQEEFEEKSLLMEDDVSLTYLAHYILKKHGLL